jgi:glycosyltransferase involved in cell wall biosynthesis
VGRDLAALRVLLVHDWMYTWGGAERCLDEVFALVPHADVVTAFVTPAMRTQHAVARRATETWVARIPGARTKHRWFLPLQALAFSGVDTRDYDLVISLSHAFSKAVGARGGARHVCYCFSPPRYLWDLQSTYDRFASPLQRVALRAGASVMRGMDRRAASGVHRFVGISRYVADRIHRAYGRDSDVVYPPVQRKDSATNGTLPREPFLLSLGRLVPYKRVDLAIEAAERLQMRLVVAGDGPDRARLQALAGPRTEFRGAVSDAEAGRLFATCAAFVFCAEEDFGIAPVEANAHGAAVVAFAGGAALETMDDGETAVLFSRQDVDSLTAAIERCLATTWSASALRHNAARFAPEHFRTAFSAVLDRALS